MLETARPWVPMTIRSAGNDRAQSSTRSAGAPPSRRALHGTRAPTVGCMKSLSRTEQLIAIDGQRFQPAALRKQDRRLEHELPTV